MSFFRLRSSPVSDWPRLPPEAVNPVWLIYRELDRSQWLKPAELEQLQLGQVRLLLEHCARQVPYYQRLFAASGIVPQQVRSLADFRRIPRLTRELYQAHFNDLGARELPAGTTGTGTAFTSGTNGVPVQVRQTSDVDQWWLACCLRDLEWCDIQPTGRLAVIRMIAGSREKGERLKDGVFTPYWHPFLHTFLETGQVHAMDVHQEPRRLLQWLREIRPDYLLGMPTNLDYLAGLIIEDGARLPELRVIQAISEALSEDVQRRIETAFGVPVKSLYSTTETGYIASPCPQGQGWHVHAENVLLEILDAHDKPCPPGQSGRVVLTSLRNFLAPFIRYEILDEATLAPGLCPCGRGLPLLTRIDGRRHPLLHLPDGRRKIISRLYLQLRAAGGSLQFQLIQRAVDHVIVRVVPDRTWTPEHTERIRQLVQEHMESPIRVDVVLQERLELPASGKLQIAVIEMDEPPRPAGP
jgi:phenylacetate-CoA ligase